MFAHCHGCNKFLHLRHSYGDDGVKMYCPECGFQASLSRKDAVVYRGFFICPDCHEVACSGAPKTDGTLFQQASLCVIVHDLLRKALNGGFSFSIHHDRFCEESFGYAVSLRGHEVKVSLDLTDDEIRSEMITYIDRRWPRLSVPTRYFGAWVEDGHLVLDVSVWIKDLDVAMMEARANKQRAIYDFANKQALPVEYPAPPKEWDSPAP